jgi:DNA-binding beta-propeller fold protein YncE
MRRCGRLAKKLARPSTLVTRTLRLAGLAPIAVALVANAGPQLAPISVTDPLPGSTRLPNGWKLDPAGRQVLTSRAPTGVAVTPDGSTAYAVTSGIFEEAVERIDATTLIATPTLIGEAYQGVAADANGNVWVSGGPANAVFQYLAVGPLLIDLRQAGPAPLTPNRGIPVTGFPGNMLLAGPKLFVAGNLSVPSGTATGAGACDRGSSICSVVNVIDVSDPTAQSPAVHAIAVGRNAFGLAYRAVSQTLYVSNWADQTNSSSANPFAGSGTVSVVRVNADGTGSQIQVVGAGLGPAGIALSPDGGRLAVADSDSDQLSLYAINPVDGTIGGSQTIDLHLSPSAPLGTTPLAVAYSPDGAYLFVTLAGIDAIEVRNADGSPIPQTVEVDEVTVNAPGTFIPTGWYPDAVVAATSPQQETRLYVANIRGNGSGPGYYGQLSPLVGTSTEGTLSVIDLPAGSNDRANAFRSWTRRVVASDELAPVWASVPDPATDACLPARLRGAGEVRSELLCEAQQGTLASRIGAVHVVMILAENKTFDSYFGDTGLEFPGADADPVFTEYGVAVTTNQHALAGAFTLSDNFYNEGAESSVLGHSWFSGGYTTVRDELLWNMDYDQSLRGNRLGGQYAGNALGGAKSDATVAAVENGTNDPRRRLADEIHDAGISERIYATDLNGDSAARADQLDPVGFYWGEGAHAPTDTDLSFPDTDRANLFLHGTTISHAWDLLQGPPPPTFNQPYPPPGNPFGPFPAGFTLDRWNADYEACRSAGGSDPACQSTMPAFLYMTLPENHTFDLEITFNPLDPTLQSMVADNDYAIGLVIDGLSHSPFWKNTVVFLTEDDNQFTGDHVDVHRTFLLTMGGLARRLGARHAVSHQRGSFPSVLKTVEILLGVPPLTLFDWRAVPLHDVIAADDAAIDAVPYKAVLPPTPFFGRGVP